MPTKARNALFLFCMGAQGAAFGMGEGFRLAKADFHLLAIEVQCPTPACEFLDEVAPEVVDIGRVGEGKFADPAKVEEANADSRGPRLVFGFPEEHFDWGRHTQGLPGGRSRLAVLNELTSSGKSHALLSMWKPAGGGFEFERLLPVVLSAPLGEFSFQGSPRAERGGALILVKAIGSDAGVNLQAFYVLNLLGSDRLRRLKEISNKSEIPVSEILARLNDGKPAEEVLDSALQCELGRGARGSNLRCTKSRTRILYTLQGPQETPLGKESFSVEWAAPGRR